MIELEDKIYDGTAAKAIGPVVFSDIERRAAEEKRLAIERGKQALRARIAMGLPVLDATPQDLVEMREAEERAYAEVKGNLDAAARDEMIRKREKQLRDKGNPSCENVEVTVNTLKEYRPVNSE